MLSKDNRDKIKDLSLSIGAIAILNIVIQFVLYPFVQRRLGNEAYGVALSLLALISIASNSVGTAANYSRLVNERELKPQNGDYNLLLLFGGILSAGAGLLFLWRLDLLTPVSAAVYAALIVITTFRYYSDVEFKLNGNTLRYFFFHVLISVGYVLGLLFYRLTGNWMVAVLTGEVFGIAFAALFSKIYRRPFRPSKAFGLVWKSMAFLLLSNLLENLTLNADRLILLAFSGGEAVSVFYTASLFGKVVALLTVPVNAVLISYLVRFNLSLTKKLWWIFLFFGVVCGSLCFIGCLIGSYLILPLLYESLFPLTKGILVPAIAGQIFYFVSGVLLVVLLRYFGEKKQFYANLVYGVGFFALVLLGTWKFGLNGFVWFSFAANLLRLVCVALWGFAYRGKKGGKPQEIAEEVSFTVPSEGAVLEPAEPRSEEIR